MVEIHPSSVALLIPVCFENFPEGKRNQFPPGTLRSPGRSMETTDLGLSAYLIVRGFELQRLAPQQRWRVVFVFPSEANATAETYYHGGAAQAQVMFDAVCHLKGALARAKSSH